MSVFLIWLVQAPQRSTWAMRQTTGRWAMSGFGSRACGAPYNMLSWRLTSFYNASVDMI